MEAKIKLATKKVVTINNSLKIGLEKNNSRLVNKYVSQLRENLEELDQSCISAEIEGVNKTESYFTKANEVSDLANTLLIEADEYLLKVEEAEKVSAVQRVTNAKLTELGYQLACFRDSLTNPVDKHVSDLDGTQQSEAIEKLVVDKRKQMQTFEDQKINLMSQIEDDPEATKKLELLYRSTSEALGLWVDAALRYTGKFERNELKGEKESTKGPGLKLDRLALPIFRGNMRNFARFIREFDNTVGLEFKDPKIKLMYLQNQCLDGQAKELVRNLVSYDEAILRLKERYGKPSLIIDTVLRDLAELRLNAEDPKAIVLLSRCFEKAWDDMTAIDSVDEFCNVVTLRTIEGKLPQRLQLLWAEEKNEKGYETSKSAMNGLKEFTERHRRIAEEAIAMRGNKNENTRNERLPYNSKGKPSSHINVVETPIQKSKGCFRCGFNHLVKDCKVPSSIKCRRCGIIGHIENACRKSPPPDNVKPRTNLYAPPVSNTEVKNNTRLPIQELSTEYGPCTALWDSGSAINLVSTDWAKGMGIIGEPCQLKFKVVDGTVNSVNTECFRIGLVDRSSNVKIIRAYGLDNLATCASALDPQTLEQFSVNIDEIDRTSGKIQLLLGSGCAGIFPTIVEKHDDFCLMRSNYGVKEYLVTGSQEYTRESHFGPVMNIEYVRVTPTHDVCSSVVAQVAELKDFMSVEELGIRPPPICRTCKNCEVCRPASQFLSLKEHRELNVIKSKLCYDEQTEEWTASYPYKRDPLVLNDNFNSALKVLKRRENKMLKDPYLFQNYCTQIKDFLERGVIRKMTDIELKTWTGPVRYVDHREVIKEGSTTPVRIVINSSFRDGNELSLNDILMKGPNVLTSLLQVLIKWRLFPVAFLGDISKMYHNVRTGELEANLRRLLWRECEQNRPPDIYCFEKVTFGDRPAGCIVVSALQATAEMYSHLSKKAAQVLKQDSYMDDTLSGDNSIKEAQDLVSDIQTIAKKGGFKYKKFIFSGEFEDNGDRKPTEKALGVIWEPSEDILRVEVELNHNKKNRGHRREPAELEHIPYTRRVCLRLVNGIYDPLGLVSPVTVKLKMLMKKQFVVQTKYKKWDTLLDESDKLEWIHVLQEVLKLKDIAVPRHPINAPYPNVSDSGKFTLVCFTDASQEAMCAAIYLRYETANGEVDAGLIAAKTKVSPVKTLTMPRLELCASLLGARLSSKVISSIENEHKCFESKYFLMDSKIALGVLNKCHLSDEFNGNCAAEVRGKTEEFTFAWVETKENIADLGSRGTSVDHIQVNSRWQRGPEWLHKPIADWPIEIHSLETIPDVDFIQHSEPIINAEKFSDIEKLHKLTALCLKFAHSRGTGTNGSSDWRRIKLMPKDYEKAEQYWIKEVSRSVVRLYEAGKLQSLRPAAVWDEEGQFLKIVTSGRLGELLKIGYDIEELTILDPSHPYTKLVLKKYHDEDHGGTDRTVWKSRQKFWIPQARRVVKGIRSKCYRCRLLERRQVGQLMAPLPNQRVLPTPAWTYTSLDLFGPLEHVDMVRKRIKEKCWGIIFTCMVTRAVHLDLTQAYHTDALLQAIRRFMSVRGCPREFLSDQGTQMVACHKELSVVLELIDWSLIEGWCSRKSVVWKFVPPQGQHMNGVSESLIRSTKKLLQQTIEGKRLNFIEIQTVLMEISQVMNARPLGLYSRPGDDPLNGGPVTPNHLLLGRATQNIPYLKFTNVSQTKRMKFMQVVVEEFWKKWKEVVFHSLVPQYKWHKTQRNIQVGDVVLMVDENALVGEYRLGQVSEVKVSKDGLVRSARIRCVGRTNGKITKSILDRPVHKLCVIVPKEEQ